MNWHFAREVGLPKFLWRRGMIALRRALSSKPVRFHLPTGGQLICPHWSPSAQDAFVTAADVDWGSEAFFFRHLARDGDFLDVGANIGYYSMYGAPVVRRVFSFEPDPRNHSALGENARLAGNIIIEKVALSSHDGVVQLELGEESSVSKVAEGPDDGSGRKLEVPALTLDSFAHSRPDLRVTGIKLDTEGHELPILRAGVETIRRDQPLILTELMRWPGQGDDAFPNLAEFATSLNYQPFAFVPQSPGFLRAGHYQLTAMDSLKVFSTNPTKMIFLVPERLVGEFHART
ncbi:MAG: FkbM family methyltransferase [Chthoniobacteraceae bacterium]